MGDDDARAELLRAGGRLDLQACQLLPPSGDDCSSRVLARAAGLGFLRRGVVFPRDKFVIYVLMFLLTTLIT